MRIFALVLCASGMFAFFRPASAAATDRTVSDYLPLLTSIEGQLQGDLTAITGHPLAWRFSLAPANPRGDTPRRGELSVSGSDLVLRISVDYEPAAARLNWQVMEGRVDLASWLPALATLPELASTLEGLSASGIIAVTGGGTWTDGRATGGLRLELDEGVVRNDTAGWTLEGVTLRIGGDAASLFAGEIPMHLGVRTISTARFGARSFKLSAHIKEFNRVQVQSARVEIAGGEVTTEPFDVALGHPAVNATVLMSKVGLQDLVVFVPTTLSEAQGRVNGRLGLSWDPDGGVRIGAGELTLDHSEPTTLRLVSTPGFLTEKVPARFTFLPASFGVFSRWFSSPNEAHGSLAAIERGQVRLRVNTMEVRLTPHGDTRGRSASVVIRARPEQADSAIGEVTFEINVAGPLAAVLRLGMEQNLSLQLR